MDFIYQTDSSIKFKVKAWHCRLLLFSLSKKQWEKEKGQGTKSHINRVVLFLIHCNYKLMKWIVDENLYNRCYMCYVCYKDYASEFCFSGTVSKLVEISEKHLQHLLTTAVAKQGWWLNSKETFSEGSRAPAREITFKAMLLCSATCSSLLSSANFSGSLEKLLLTSFVILWASLK